MKTGIISAIAAAAALSGAVCLNAGAQESAGDIPAGGHGIAVAAHRGYWKCEEGGFSHNSIASLRAAQEYGFWGSEMDVHLTADDSLVVFHDDMIGGIRVDESTYAELCAFRLNNGEMIPTLDEYLAQAARNPKVTVVCEFKEHPTEAQEDRLVELTVAKLRDHGMYDPGRVMFISFSRHICDVVAASMPEFTNQYLGDDYSPDDLADAGINGIDFEYGLFYTHPEWYARARERGMSVNCWTVNSREDIENMIRLGVDCITSDNPDLVRSVLGEMGVAEK